MGIRFYCPKGHKLNVKQFQAGRTGVCPRCGATVPIPLKSTRRSSRRTWTAFLGKTTGEGVAAGSSSGGGGPPPIASPPTRLADPLAEAGKAVWYFRSAAGEQFGPAAADVMRGWLAEGRITADALVWREGWRDWRPAGGVFPQLSPNPPIPGLETIPPEPLVTPIYPHHARIRPPRRTQLAVIGGLLLVLFLLSIILLLIASRP